MNGIVDDCTQVFLSVCFVDFSNGMVSDLLWMVETWREVRCYQQRHLHYYVHISVEQITNNAFRFGYKG